MYVCVYAYISLAFYLKSLVIRQWHYVCDLMFKVFNKKFVTKKKKAIYWLSIAVQEQCWTDCGEFKKKIKIDTAESEISILILSIRLW